MEFIIDQLVTWWQFTVVGVLIIIGFIINIFGVDCDDVIIDDHQLVGFAPYLAVKA